MTPPHPLLDLYVAAARGNFPDVDGRVRVMPGLGRGLEAVIGFTGHGIVASALPAAAILGQGIDAFGGCFAPAFLCWLAGPQGKLGSIDATLVARGLGGGSLPRRPDLEQHPRVQLARRLRTDVEVYGDERGLVTLSNGLAGRRELSIELVAERQGRGLGRSLLKDALRRVPAGEPVFAAVAPGNARSLRIFVALGFMPIGCELVLTPERPARTSGFSD